MSCGCTHVVMESTGEYWRPVFNVLEEAESLHMVLANSQQVKGLRGHKTDPQDAHWLAHLLRHGMIRLSYIPPPCIRQLRDLTRRRRQTAIHENRPQSHARNSSCQTDSTPYQEAQDSTASIANSKQSLAMLTSTIYFSEQRQ